MVSRAGGKFQFLCDIYKSWFCSTLLKRNGNPLCFCGLAQSDWTHPICFSSLLYTTSFPRRETSEKHRQQENGSSETTVSECGNRNVPKKNVRWIPPITIAESWPISVPSNTPRQILFLSCKKIPEKNMMNDLWYGFAPLVENFRGNIAVDVQNWIGRLINMKVDHGNLHWWLSSPQEG